MKKVFAIWTVSVLMIAVLSTILTILAEEEPADNPLCPKGCVLFDESHDPPSWYTISSGYSGFADLLRAAGHTVDANLATPLTADILSGYEKLIIVCPHIPYNATEITVITEFVQGGGGLFLIGEWGGLFGAANLDPIAEGFGVTFDDNRVYDPTDYEVNTDWVVYDADNMAIHPITCGVSSFMLLRSCSLALEAPALALAWGDEDTYTDPASTPPIVLLAAAEFGNGRVVCVGDGNAFDNSDHDGDGVINLYEHDNEVLTLNVIDWLQEWIPAIVRIDPKTLNVHGPPSVTGYIEFPSSYDVHLINVTTIRLNCSIPIERYDFQDDKLMVKFDSTAVINLISPPPPPPKVNVTLGIRGRLIDGTPFYGSDMISVI